MDGIERLEADDPKKYKVPGSLLKREWGLEGKGRTLTAMERPSGPGCLHFSASATPGAFDAGATPKVGAAIARNES